MTTPLGKYKLVKLIASGGMAEVYLAKQAGAAGFEKMVCLKRILPHLARDKQFVDMFLNEARLAAQLDHPNIVSIFDLGEANGNYFIAMEFIDGPSLRAVAKRASERGEYLPIPELCKIIAMAAGGLEHAHNLADAQGHPLGLVHRDISPDNILVHRNGAAKVVDFGIAKAANSSGATRTGTLKGKVAYMPPEQLRGEQLDRRVDVFALGVVLYELLAGKRPWEGDSEVALIGRIMTEDPAPLGDTRTDAPQELLDIVAKALSKDRNTRYQNCADLQSELENLLVAMGQTITPARVSDFVKAYSPEASGPTTSAAEESTGAMLRALENEMNGTGTGVAPSLVASGRRQDNDHHTVAVMSPVDSGRGRSGIVYGLGAFLAIAIIGGAGGYFLFFRGKDADDSLDPVVIEHAAVAAKPQVLVPPPVKPPEPQVETAKPVDPPPVQTVKVDPPVEPQAPAKIDHRPPGKQRKPAVLAETEPPPSPPPATVTMLQQPAPTPVVIVKEQPPPPPPPAVIAKGELRLLIRPWAKIEVDGREVGVTPLTDPLILTAGDHKVRLVNPALGKDIVRTVHIVANDKQILKEILDE
jgi:eukaryotic-like serine/threonine-protein kinase